MGNSTAQPSSIAIKLDDPRSVSGEGMTARLDTASVTIAKASRVTWLATVRSDVPLPHCGVLLENEFKLKKDGDEANYTYLLLHALRRSDDATRPKFDERAQRVCEAVAGMLGGREAGAQCPWAVDIVCSRQQLCKNPLCRAGATL